MNNYTKNYHVLYTHYRQTVEGESFALLEPEHHIFYLDLIWHGRKGLRFTWAEMAFHMRSSVKTLMSYMDRLGDVKLVRFPNGPEYSEDKLDDYLRAPTQPEGSDAGQGFDKDWDVLHEFYRHALGEYPPLLTPFKHLLYLDLKCITSVGMQSTLDSIRASYKNCSRKDIFRWLEHLQKIDLIQCDLSNLSFTNKFDFIVNEPYFVEELLNGKREELLKRV